MPIAGTISSLHRIYSNFMDLNTKGTCLLSEVEQILVYDQFKEIQTIRNANKIFTGHYHFVFNSYTGL